MGKRKTELPCTFDGNLLPLFGKSEQDWWNPLRVVLYMTGLFWTFLGVAIISDVFMAGIEKVTSLKRRVTNPTTGRTITVHVWNATVANLTLMALGSSAPEILLSVIEVLTNKMFVGELGAGTIVGSAAFNLLIISAVCVMSIPDGEVRYVKEVSVYAITATCSVFAYLWLMFILMLSTPDVCTIWEGVVTLLFFPILVYAAYYADRGRFFWQKTSGREPLQTIPEDVTKEELAQIEQQIREDHGSDLSAEKVVEIMAAKYFHQRSRAYYRHASMQHAVSIAGPSIQPKRSVGPSEFTVNKINDTGDYIEHERSQKVIRVGFKCARYAFLENCGHAILHVCRLGPTGVKVSVRYSTRDGSAQAGSDYVADEGTITFEKLETEKKLTIKILDDNAYEENEEFYVDLLDVQADMEDTSKGVEVKFTEINKATVVIIDDDESGTLRFTEEETTVIEGVEEKTVEIEVERFNGASGTISCKYYTEDMLGKADVDYEPTAGEISFGPNVQTQKIPVIIKTKGRYMNSSDFNVCLANPVNCKFDEHTDGGEEKCICHVVIMGEAGEPRLSLLRRMESQIKVQNILLGHHEWRQQFYDALFNVSGDDDEGGDAGPPSYFDIFMHIVSVPWKLLFAIVPPVSYLGGWACFVCSLMMIGVVTAIVGDMANLVGCCLTIEPEITAITFVALGTSLPDTFASKTAAVMEPYADAPIGNITGSNSVNVFLGLGISWTMGALYWQTRTPSNDWLNKFKPEGIYEDVKSNVEKARSGGDAVFVVPQGTLGFNLAVFSFNAFCALQHLAARRRKFGGELGGPKRGFFGQYFSASFLVLQWFIYVGASSIYATIKAKERD